MDKLCNSGELRSRAVVAWIIYSYIDTNRTRYHRLESRCERFAAASTDATWQHLDLAIDRFECRYGLTTDTKKTLKELCVAFNTPRTVYI